MRLGLLFICLASPVAAWDFSPSPICTLSHSTDTTGLTVTYDGAATEPYSIEITGPGIAPAPVFGIRFSGGAGLTIQTTRHVVKGNSVRVSDRGFGNVLNGIEYSDTATALLGDAEIPFALDGADAPMQAFRACIASPVA